MSDAIKISLGLAIAAMVIGAVGWFLVSIAASLVAVASIAGMVCVACASIGLCGFVVDRVVDIPRPIIRDDNSRISIEDYGCRDERRYY